MSKEITHNEGKRNPLSATDNAFYAAVLIGGGIRKHVIKGDITHEEAIARAAETVLSFTDQKVDPRDLLKLGQEDTHTFVEVVTKRNREWVRNYVEQKDSAKFAK